MSEDPKHCLNTCNALLRGERSAVDAYGQALERYHDQFEIVRELTRIRDEHVSAVHALEERVRAMGGEPSANAGAWGALTSAVQTTANLLGAGSALEALKSGESAGRGDYEKTLEDIRVMPECRDLIRTRLLPPVLEHLATLERLQHAA